MPPNHTKGTSANHEEDARPRDGGATAPMRAELQRLRCMVCVTMILVLLQLAMWVALGIVLAQQYPTWEALAHRVDTFVHRGDVVVNHTEEVLCRIPFDDPLAWCSA